MPNLWSMDHQSQFYVDIFNDCFSFFDLIPDQKILGLNMFRAAKSFFVFWVKYNWAINTINFNIIKERMYDVLSWNNPLTIHLNSDSITIDIGMWTQLQKCTQKKKDKMKQLELIHKIKWFWMEIESKWSTCHIKQRCM